MNEEKREAKIRRMLADINEELKEYDIDKLAELINGAMVVLKKQQAFEEGKPLSVVVEEYEERSEKFNYVSSIRYGLGRLKDSFGKFLTNPARLWEVYDNFEDKKLLFDAVKCEKNGLHEEAAVGTLLQYFYDTNVEKTIMQIGKLTEADKNAYTQKLPMILRKHLFPLIEKEKKQGYITSLQAIVPRIGYLEGLEENRIVHNERMKQLGLSNLAIPENVPEFDKNGMFYGVDLNAYDSMQLGALAAFYMNRIEKIREDIDEGVFLIKSLIKDKEVYNLGMIKRNNSIDNPNETWYSLGVDRGKKRGTEITSVDEGILRESLKKYYLISKLLEESLEKQKDEIDDASVEREHNLNMVEAKDVYDIIFAKYQGAYNKVFDSHSDFRKDVEEFLNLCGLSKNIHYSSKDNIIEELIALAKEKKMNWGIILEDDNKSVLRKHMYLGFDIPGLNMPLRLHCKLEKLQEMAPRYFDDNEIPLYVGADDFIVGKNFGTQILKPITPKESDLIKAAGKQKSANPRFTNFMKHLSFIQLPNTLKKLLDWKTGKTQLTPDYMDITTGDIRRGRVIKKEPEF